MLITIDDVKAFLQSAGADFNDARIAPAIERATQRAKRLLGVDVLPETEEVKQALILLTVAELAVEINLYYRGKENVTVLRTKDVITEAERLLGLLPEEEPVKWI
jgi:hypothetical protein